MDATGTVSGVAAGQVSIIASSGGRTGQAALTVIPIPVATVSVTPGSVTLTGGATQQFSASTSGAAGESLTDRVITWSTSDSSKARVTTGGLVTAVAAGSAIITATSETKSGTATVTVRAALSISSITPSVLTEGAAATIIGIGFTPSATVRIAGLAANVASSSSTQLVVTVPARDCQPQRAEVVVISVGGESATAQAVVKGLNPLTLAANSFTWSGSDQCIRLDAAPVGARYVIGMLSTSDLPSALTPSQLLASVGDVPVVASASVKTTDARRIGVVPTLGRLGFPQGPVVSPIELGSTGRRNGIAEAKLRESERVLLASLDKRAAREWLRRRGSVSTRGAFVQAALALGDTATFNVPGGTFSCASASTVRAVVRYVGADNIWVEDIANPVTAFSAAEYQEMEVFYATKIKPVLSSYVGPLTDIDSNQQNVVLITKEVNKKPNIWGFVWGGDLFPVSQCAVSNSAEIFYGFAPDPDGTFGQVYTSSFVKGLYRLLMAHELTHVIQLGQQVYGTAGTKAIWELEGGATLSEQLVGFRVYGFASGQNLGLTPILNDTEWFRLWVSDLAVYFGWLSNTTRSLGAPEQCTWLGRLSDGNTGPCDAFRMVYGVPATLMRFVLDRYGPAYPGGETALMRNMVASPHAGYASLTTAAGVSTNELLTWLGVMLWSDGKTSNTLASWNLFDIFNGFVSTAQLAPYTSTSPQPTLPASVRAGSTAFLEWSPPGATAPTSLRIRSPTGGAVPGTMVLWVYRYQ